MELWIKALHVIAIIAWMAGLFYLPRLYVYHVNAAPGGELATQLTVMERRLLRVIMNPAMLAAWIFGLWAAVNAGAFSETWFQVKFLLVVAMTAAHMFFAKCRKDFENGTNSRSEKFFRLANEIPTVLMIFIVILVIVRPF